MTALNKPVSMNLIVMAQLLTKHVTAKRWCAMCTISPLLLSNSVQTTVQLATMLSFVSNQLQFCGTSSTGASLCLLGTLSICSSLLTFMYRCTYKPNKYSIFSDKSNDEVQNSSLDSIDVR